MCQICHVTFSDQSAISAHYDTAHDARHKCDVCEMKFAQKGQLSEHLASVHGLGQRKSFACDVYKSALTRHMKTVHK